MVWLFLPVNVSNPPSKNDKVGMQPKEPGDEFTCSIVNGVHKWSQEQNFRDLFINKYTYSGVVKFFIKYFTLKIPHWIYKGFKKFYQGYFHIIIPTLRSIW